jgi:hypothetical protein
MMDASSSAWHKDIKRYENNAREWLDASKNIIKRYKDKRGDKDNAATKLNIFWSTVQTLLPALYARNPKPDVSRRFLDSDPIGRVAADVLERCCSYAVNNDLFGQAMRQAVLDYLLCGRGVTWVRYVPHFQDANFGQSEEIAGDGIQLTDDAEIGEHAAQQNQQVVSYEETALDYVHWEDFGHSTGRTWEEVQAVWRRAYLTEKQLKERFVDFYAAGGTIPLDYKQKDDKGTELENTTNKAVIYEIWDKATKTVYWVHRDVPTILDAQEDPFNLKGFFPCPRPLFANLANDTCIPTPDYHQFKSQSIQLDSLTTRITQITKSIKVAGVYDGAQQGVERLLAEGVENQLLKVDSWMAFAEKGGLKSAIDLLPMQDMVQTLLSLYDARERVKNDLYEITGISDIIRGNTDARETAKAQQMKGQFAMLRLSDRQEDVQRFARDTIRIIGEYIAGHFQLETIKMISGVRLFTEQEKQVYGAALQQMQAGQQPQVPLPKDLRPDELQDVMQKPSWEEVYQLLQDEPARCFRIDIQTDSTIKADKQAERLEKLDFLSNVSGFIGQAASAVTENPNLAPVMAQMLMFGVRAFDMDKDLEQTLNTFITKTQQEQGQQKPDKDQMKIQADQQAEQAKLQAQMQMKSQEMQLSVQAENAKQQAQMEQETIQQQNQMALEKYKHEQIMQLEQFKVQQQQSMTLAIEQMKAEAAYNLEKLKSDTSILVAQISANTALSTAAMGAQEDASKDLATDA